MFVRQQLALVCVETTAGTYRIGTGYLVRPDLVLTALHVWTGQADASPPHAVTVRLLDGAEFLPAAVAWSSGSEVDACMLRLQCTMPGIDPPQWGNYDRTSAVACTSWGYPAASKPSLSICDILSIRGTIELGDGYHTEQHGIAVEAPPSNAEHWSGMSGAPVFADNHLVGIVRGYRTGTGSARLFMTPVRRMLADAAFADLVGNPPTRLVPVSALSPRIREREWGNPATLLHADYQVVPFFEPCRRAELQALHDWLDSRPRAPSVRLFVGPGGTGKTRLFIEWCARLRTHGWDAGFLDATVSSDALDALLASERDTFVVIDYAEMQPRLFVTLQAMLQTRGGRFHVALLARNAGDWWQSLRQRHFELGECLAAFPPLPLSAVRVEEDQRASAFTEACRAFAQAQGYEQASWPVVALDDERFSRMLYIHMAALAAVEGQTVPAHELLAYTLKREQQVWLRRYREKKDHEYAELTENAARVVAAVTLRGGAASAGEARAVVTRVARLTDDFVRVLRDLYPGQSGERGAFLSGLEPDLLGEALVARVLKDEWTPIDYLADVFTGADQAALRAGFILLGRIAIDQPKEASSWLARVLDNDILGRADAGIYLALAPALPAVFTEKLAWCAHSLAERLQGLERNVEQDADLIQARALLKTMGA